MGNTAQISNSRIEEISLISFKRRSKFSIIIKANGHSRRKRRENEIKQIIDEAIEKQKFIEIDYQDFFNKITKKRRVFPLRIENQSGQIYLESIDLELNESRSFRFDRIIAVKTKDRIDVKASIEHLPKQGKVTLTFANWQLKIPPKIEWKILTQNQDKVTVEIDYYDLDYVVEILLKLSSDFRIDCLEVEKKYIKKQTNKDILIS